MRPVLLLVSLLICVGCRPASQPISQVSTDSQVGNLASQEASNKTYGDLRNTTPGQLFNRTKAFTSRNLKVGKTILFRLKHQQSRSAQTMNSAWKIGNVSKSSAFGNWQLSNVHTLNFKAPAEDAQEEYCSTSAPALKEEAEEGRPIELAPSDLADYGLIGLDDFVMIKLKAPKYPKTSTGALSWRLARVHSANRHCLYLDTTAQANNQESISPSASASSGTSSIEAFAWSDVLESSLAVLKREDFALDPPMPARITLAEKNSPPSILVIGDLHGDAGILIKILKQAKFLDEQQNWIAGKSILVQTGDLLDRGPEDIRLLFEFQLLKDKARARGGDVIQIVGNHETVTVKAADRFQNFLSSKTAGQSLALSENTVEFIPVLKTGESANNREILRYINFSKDKSLTRYQNKSLDQTAQVQVDGYTQFEEFSDLLADYSISLGAMPGYEARLHAFAPGNALAKMMSGFGSIVVLNRNVFVHGGVTMKHVESWTKSNKLRVVRKEVKKGIQDLNISLSQWVAQRSWNLNTGSWSIAKKVEAFKAPDLFAQKDSYSNSPQWTRDWSAKKPESLDCAQVKQVLKALDADRMFIGHTPQTQKVDATSQEQKTDIVSACKGRIWRIDVYLSAAYRKLKKNLTLLKQGAVMIENSQVKVVELP